jgi:hypothetical protein
MIVGLATALAKVYVYLVQNAPTINHQWFNSLHFVMVRHVLIIQIVTEGIVIQIIISICARKYLAR